MAALSSSVSGSVRLRRADAGDVRRRQLIEATIETIAELGFNATTISEISRRAEVSTGLISFYFGDKDGLFEATLRHLARELSHSAAIGLRDARTPRERVQVVIDTVLGTRQFERRIGAVWLAFWGQVTHSPRFARVQRAYQRRTVDNLRHALRPVLDEAASKNLAETIAALVDGLWLRATLGNDSDGRAIHAAASAFVDSQFERLVFHA